MKRAIVLVAGVSAELLACVQQGGSRGSGERSFIDSVDQDFFDYYFEKALPFGASDPDLASKINCNPLDADTVAQLQDIQCTLCMGTETFRIEDIAACSKATDQESWDKLEEKQHEEGGGCRVFNDRPGGTVKQCKTIDMDVQNLKRPGFPTEPAAAFSICRMKSDEAFRTEMLEVLQEAQTVHDDIEQAANILEKSFGASGVHPRDVFGNLVV